MDVLTHTQHKDLQSKTVSTYLSILLPTVILFGIAMGGIASSLVYEDKIISAYDNAAYMEKKAKINLVYAEDLQARYRHLLKNK